MANIQTTPEGDRGFADQSIGKTYRLLRYLAGGALVLMPLFIALVGSLGSYPLQASLSDYYFLVNDGGLPRTLFVGFLAFLGGVLIAYRGLDNNDNRIHTVAGVFAFGVAAFPMHCSTSEHTYCVPGLFPSLHLPSAGLLYLFAVVAVLYAGGPKLKAALSRLPDPEKWKWRLHGIRGFSFALMTIGILTYFYHRLESTPPGTSWLFGVEYLGFLGFGIHWVRMMKFIDAANKEGKRMVAERMVTAMQEPKEARIARIQVEGPELEAEMWSEIP